MAEPITPVPIHPIGHSCGGGSVSGMADITIYHNPHCSTSVFAVTEAERLGVDVDVNLYLKTKPGKAELTAIVAKLQDPATDLVRRDSFFSKLGLKESAVQDPTDVIDVLVSHPRLLQRPLLVSSTSAIIGRPKARVEGFLTTG